MSEKPDPMHLEEAVVEHLGRAVLCLISRFTDPSPDSPSMTEGEITSFIVARIPAALRWLESEGFASFEDPA